MSGQLGDFDELSIRGSTRDAEAPLRQRALVHAVEFVPVPVAFVNQIGAIYALRERTGRQLARVAAQTHRATEIVHAEEIPQFVDDLRRSVGVAFR